MPYNRQELADYLYIERSALSRELGSMRHEGMISFERNVFCLTDD
ncbi:MAG: helix-turn-helix domain-containing protein [Gordonibacter sp.]